MADLGKIFCVHDWTSPRVSRARVQIYEARVQKLGLSACSHLILTLLTCKYNNIAYVSFKFLYLVVLRITFYIVSFIYYSLAIKQ